MHISSYCSLEDNLVPALSKLAACLRKRKSFSVIKFRRTHLQDATPVTLGQEFGGYAAQIEYGIERIRRAQKSLCELALGGTAVGTGLNTHPEFPQAAIAEISNLTGHQFLEARNHFEAQASRDAIVELSGQLKTIACSLMKIAEDIRLVGSWATLFIG
ncbi:MAG: lyase family protein [Bdellovibrionota bacterium]